MENSGPVSLRNIPIFRTGKGVVARHLTKSERTFGKSGPNIFLQNPEHAIGGEAGLGRSQAHRWSHASNAVH